MLLSWSVLFVGGRLARQGRWEGSQVERWEGGRVVRWKGGRVGGWEGGKVGKVGG